MNIEDEDLRELIYQCAGAATRPLLEDNPEYVFPSERVGQAVEECLHSLGYGRLAHFQTRRTWPIRLRLMLLRDGVHRSNAWVRDFTAWLERVRWLPR